MPDSAQDLVFRLKLLAHPTVGVQGISETERKDLLSAADMLEHQQHKLARYAEMLRMKDELITKQVNKIIHLETKPK